MNIPEAIERALREPANYAPHFTARVAELGQSLQSALRTAVAHDSDMNYRVGQYLSFITPGEKTPRSKKSAPVEVRIYLSSKAKLFAFYCFDSKAAFLPAGGLNHPLPPDLLPDYARHDIAAARALLIDQGLTEVDHSFFSMPAPGCRTEMDDLPANIFEALFAEVV